MSKKVVLIATLDTKGPAVKFLKEQIEKRGHVTLVMDTGCRAPRPIFRPDISREQVAEAAGRSMELVSSLERGKAVKIMSDGAVIIAKQLYFSGELDGVVCLGGSSGVMIAAAAIKALPIGVPKLILSPIFNLEPFFGKKDIVSMYSVTDIMGLDMLSRAILANAAGAISGMVESRLEMRQKEKPLIAATAIGLTTPCVMKAKSILESKGYEVVVFAGGQEDAMDELIEDGVIDGVLHITTKVGYELIGKDELTMRVRRPRLVTSGKKGLPLVICPGGVDTIVFPSEVPSQFRDRKLYQHLPTITIMRTNKEENAEIGRIVAERANQALGPTVVVIPLRGFTALGKEGGVLFDPEADRVFIEALKKDIKPHVRVVEVDTDINDSVFAEKVAHILDGIMKPTDKTY